MKNTNMVKLTLLTVLMTSNVLMASDAADAAKKLANPIANMISLPIQVNYQQNLGLDDKGDKWLTNIQPVIPIELNDDWNIISRTIVPLVSQEDVFPGAGSQSGVADIVQSVFFSPKAPMESGWIWGAGPVFLIPSVQKNGE
jgi:hypothetical protein